MNELQDKVAARLTGKHCANFKLIEGGALILYLERPGDPNANTALWFDCAWHLLDSNVMRTGSLDDAEIVLPALNLLCGQTIEWIEVNAITKDLRVGFTECKIIEAFNHCTQMELWEVRGADGYRLGVEDGLTVFEFFVES